MSFSRSLLFLCFFPVLAAIGLFFTGYKMISGVYTGGYAVLTADAAVNEKILHDYLAADRELITEPVVSESSQWALLDEFGSLARIPLDEYSGRIMPFDPRNDGYAQRLKDFFVSGGKRFIFIPLKPGLAVPSFTEKRIKKLLGDISCSIDFLGFGKPLRFFFVSFAAAALVMIFLCNRKKNDRTCLAGIVLCLPVLASLSFFGQAGIALASLLLGMAVLLWEPLFEFCAVLHANPIGGAERRRRLTRYVYEPYRLYLFFLPFFPLAFLFIVIHADILPLFALAVVILCGLVFFTAVRTLSFPGFHRRFRPVLIVKRRFPDFIFSVYMLPFALAVFFTAVFSHQSGGMTASAGDFNILSFSGRTVTEAEYYEHLSFQTSFSQRSMDRDGAAYPSYTMGDDGLLSVSSHGRTGENTDLGAFPPFPLKDLMNFVEKFTQPHSGNSDVYNRETGLWGDTPLLILLIFLLPGLLLRKLLPFENSRSSALKGISGRKLRWGDKKHKKILLLINKAVPKYIPELQPVKKQNSIFVRKDA